MAGFNIDPECGPIEELEDVSELRRDVDSVDVPDDTWMELYGL